MLLTRTRTQAVYIIRSSAERPLRPCVFTQLTVIPVTLAINAFAYGVYTSCKIKIALSILLVQSGQDSRAEAEQNERMRQMQSSIEEQARRQAELQATVQQSKALNETLEQRLLAQESSRRAPNKNISKWW